MPDKYHIKSSATPSQFRRIGKYGSVDYREDCSRCTNCVKPRCLYDTYKKETAHNRDPVSGVELLNECRACLSCVQGCTKGLLSIALNPEYLGMGDSYFRPDVIETTWKQADTGTIPVSGAGYRGRFHGPGFDSIWTDMSEIVRPTRDGIHGREYISTSVDIGPKPMRLSFSASGGLLTEPFELLELPIPIIFDLPAWSMDASLGKAQLKAAKSLQTLGVLQGSNLDEAQPDELGSAIPLIATDQAYLNERALASARMVEIVDGPGLLAMVERIKAIRAGIVVAVRLPLGPSTLARVLELSKGNIKVFHICADWQGREIGVDKPRHIRDAMRELHSELVKLGVRDELTLIVGGGIALAEHVPKAIICGADLVALEVAPMVAAGCRVCRGVDKATHPEHCPLNPEPIETGYAAQRIINLMVAWHSQLLEILGAMGIREVRRLRGEVGRAIFREDIEREAFGDLVRRSA
jgi:ferredoxin